MPHLITQNAKLKKTSKLIGLRVFNFGIPAFEDANGKRTCPFAGSCAKFCYAQKGAYSWSNVKPAFQFRYLATKSNDFVDDMIAEIKKKKVDSLIQLGFSYVILSVIMILVQKQKIWII